MGKCISPKKFVKSTNIICKSSKQGYETYTEIVLEKIIGDCSSEEHVCKENLVEK